MTSHSSRLRVTLGLQERGLLHWLAVESGNTDTREAGLLLMTGIRLALRRYRRLYGGLPLDPADQATIERNTPGERGATRPKDYVELEELNYSRRPTRADDQERNVPGSSGFIEMDDARTRPPWGAEELESDG